MKAGTVKIVAVCLCIICGFWAAGNAAAVGQRVSAGAQVGAWETGAVGLPAVLSGAGGILAAVLQFWKGTGTANPKTLQNLQALATLLDSGVLSWLPELAKLVQSRGIPASGSVVLTWPNQPAFRITWGAEQNQASEVVS